MTQSWMRVVGWCGCWLMALSCASSSAEGGWLQALERGQYAAALQHYEHAGRNPSDLRAWAQAQLLSAAHARESTLSRAGFATLRGLGRRADLVLTRIEDEAEPRLRAQALDIRAASGESDARAQLRALLSSPDAELVDLAHGALDPDADSDGALLESALSSPRAARRTRALQLLARAEPRPARLPGLLGVARFDPEPTLRAAALRALGRFGQAQPEVATALENALRDPDDQVRSAALDTLPQVAPAAARGLLDAQLGAASTSLSIAAAAALRRMGAAAEPERARAALLAALSSGDVAVRAQAALALSSLPADHDLLRQRLAVESWPPVRLLIALGLGVREPAAHTVLTELAQLDTVTGVEAAGELALETPSARARLLVLLRDRSPLVRASVARQLARLDSSCAELAPLLADAAWQVRLAAAGAVLRCT